MDIAIEEAIERLSEFQRNMRFGKYRGVVVDTQDPDMLGRVIAKVPAVYGEGESPWALPCLPYAGADHGLVLIPEVGDTIWVEFEGGNKNIPIWSGCFWGANPRPAPDDNLQKLMSTPGGFEIVIDEDSKEIRLAHPDGAEVILGGDEITLSIGQAKIAMSSSEISINDGMAKITTSGASLVNDAFKVGG